MKKEVFIGLTYGDPAGIGPEILFKTLSSWKFKFLPMVFGSDNLQVENIKLGFPSLESGLDSYNSLIKAVSSAKKKKIIALVTGPVSKYAINLTGKKFEGQTDEIAKQCGIPKSNVIMLFAATDLRIALFTRHIPLKSLFKRLNKSSLENFIILLNKELKSKLRIKNPKIAVLGLNPHASENGLFGNEEEKIISPVVKKLNKKGIKVFGPLSPDATLSNAGKLYLSKKDQPYDTYVSLYHDQALPMFKAVAGFNGVNVTLGLPFLRVSVDHGTAFDIAGKNKASNEGLISAIRFVERILGS